MPADHYIDFYKNLHPPYPLPHKIEWLNPQKDPSVMKVITSFFQKYYNDNEPRTILLGINPGRFGAGVTGVNFTAPKQLTNFCKIDHPFKLQSEISAEFIYEVICSYGGPDIFYSKFFIGSICPLGFIKEGRNINYYDDKELLQTVEPFIIESMNTLLSVPYNKEVVYCIGGEKNYKYLNRINSKHQWFKSIEVLAHPRFIMQYKRKQKEIYMNGYLDLLGK